MKEMVIYFNKCLKCNNLTDCVLRVKKSSDMPDKAIYSLIDSYTKDPLENRYCESCECHTLQMRVGWKY